MHDITKQKTNILRNILCVHTIADTIFPLSSLLSSPLKSLTKKIRRLMEHNASAFHECHCHPCKFETKDFIAEHEARKSFHSTAQS